jgi:hypothetical protein
MSGEAIIDDKDTLQCGRNEKDYLRSQLTGENGKVCNFMQVFRCCLHVNLTSQNIYGTEIAGPEHLKSHKFSGDGDPDRRDSSFHFSRRTARFTLL